MSTNDVIRLPHIDYAAHPAYGRVLAPPRVRDRVTAVRRLMPSLVRFALKGGAAGARRVLAGRVRASDSGAGHAAYHTLARDGVVGFRVQPAQKARIEAVLAPYAERLAARLAALPVARRTFTDNQLILKPAPSAWMAALRRVAEAAGMLSASVTAPEVFGVIDAVLEELGIPALAIAHRRRRLRTEVLALQFNAAGETIQSAHFTDVGLPDPRTTYMHIDTQYAIMKCLLYLSRVGPENGPFRYVRGSHLRRRHPIDSWIRFAMDYAGMSSRRPDARRLFFSLPRRLQRKADFGTDLLDGGTDADGLLAREHSFTSDADGDLILFDNHGIHRGGMVAQGCRRILQIQLR